MAALTPDSVIRESNGSLTLHIAKFISQDVDGGDNWDSKLGDAVVGWWFQATDGSDSSTASNSVAVANSSGNFWFQCEEATRLGYLYILSRS